MKKSHLRLSLRWALLFAILISGSVGSYLRAQSTANYTFATSTSGSLGLDLNGNTVDMTTGTTQILATNTSQDQAINSASISFPAGFDFYLGGTRFGSFFATSNGIVQLGTPAVINTSTYVAGGGTTAAPRLSAFDGDLGTGTNGGIFGKLVGTAPNRCYVIEFRNMTLMWTSAYTNDGTYQMRFYENTGVIEYVYGTMNCTSIGSASDATPEVGFSWGSAANQSFSVNIGTSATDISGTMIQNTIAAGPITNLNSAAEGSRRTYSFTPVVTTAPSGLNFTAVALNGMTLNWTDNSSNELGFAIYRSTDGINYTFAGTVAANATTYNATGLGSGISYMWKVVAFTEGNVSAPATGTQATTAGTLSGIKTVGTGGDYSNLTTAFAAINASGLSGDIELQLIAGYPAVAETYPIVSSTEAAVGSYNVKVYPTVSGLSITSANTTGTLTLNNAKNITFDGRVNQTGANDLIIANTNAGASYAVQFINDARNNTLQNLILQSVNTSTTSGTIVIAGTTGTNGNDNNTITGCDIRDGATSPANAIYSVGTTSTTNHFNDNIVISNNNISNFFSAGSVTVGVFAGNGNNAWTISGNKFFQTATRTYTSGNTHQVIQISNTAGGGFAITGNTIGYAAADGTGTYTIAGTIATRFIGINLAVGSGVPSSVQNNTVTAITMNTSSGASSANGVFAGINVTAGAVNVGTVTGNTIGSTTAANAISVTSSTTSALAVGVNSSSSSGVVTIANNGIGGFTVQGSSATISASITGILASAGAPVITGNTIGSTTVANSMNSSTVTTSGSQIIRGIDVSASGGAITIQNNTVANMNQSGTTTGSNIRGIAYTGSAIATISQNTVYNLSGANANTTAGSTGVTGIIHSGSASGGATITGNTIYGLSATNTGAVQTNVTGISFAGPTAGTVTKNRIYNLSNASTMTTATTPPTVAGITLRSVIISVNVNNNMISLGDGQTTNTQFIGIWNNITSSGAINVYHNSVSISGTAASGALPSYGFQRGDNSATAINSTVDIRNNIFSNLRSGGTGKHYAIANQSTTGSATGWATNASNFNILNTASTATVGLWGSTDADFNAWRLAASSDANSFSAVTVNFVDITTANLHLNMGVTATPMESGGTPIASVTTDYDSQTRPGPSGSVNGGATSSDIGADEFDGVPALPVITLNSVTPPAAMQCTASSRLVSVNITTPVGTIASAYIGYSINGTAQTPIPMANTSGSTWQGTIPVPSPANATIAWGVSATNTAALTGGYVGTTYADEPLLGISAASNASLATVCAGDPTVLTANLASATMSTYANPPAVSNPITDEDLGNITITQGATTVLNNTSAINSLTGTIGTATGTAGSFSDYTAFGPYGLTAGQTYNFSLSTLQAATAYNNSGAIYIDYNRNGLFTDAGEAVYVASATTSGAHTETGSFTVPANAFNGNTRMRVVVNEGLVTGPTMSISYGEYEDYMLTISGGITGGGAVPAITSVSWSDGATTVGTTNPATVNPTTTTNYTATVTALACTVVSNATTITVNPLPSAPTASNSTQCGLQVPTASVTSTTGAPTPTFKWYSAATGGTVLQTGTSTSYTTAISTTTTFYVSEVNGTTSCESPRTAVTVTVAVPDPVSANASAASICLGESITLTGANTNGTPVQSYTYSWSSAANSGASSPVAGASVTITPTAAGSYTYTLTAVDGGCTASNTTAVTVKAVPTAVTATSSLATVCAGQSVSLDVTATGNAAVAVNNVQSFNTWPPAGWTFINAGSGNQWTNSTTAYAGGGSMYYAYNIAAAANAWGISDARTMYAGVAYNVSFWYKVQSASYPEKLQLTVGNAATVVGQTTVLWNNNGGANLTNTAWAQATVTFTPTVTGTYYFGFNCYSDANQYNLFVDEFTVSGNEDPLTYSWTSSPAGFTSAVKNPTGVTPSTATTYTVSVTNNVGCAASATTSVAVNALPSVNAGIDQTVCQGSTVTLSGSGATSYSWDNSVTNGVGFAAATTTTYTVTGTDANGCQNTDQVVVNVNALPAVNAGTDVSVCTGASATLSGSGADSYSWDNSVSNGVAFTPSATTTYTVTGTDVNGCQNTDQVTVTVNTLPSVDAGADIASCIGSSVTLAGSGAVSYNWNNGVTDGVAFTASATNTYTVTGTDANGCQNTDQIVVTVNALPTVSAGADQSICENALTTLSGSGAVTYTWDNGVTDGVAFVVPGGSTTFTVTGTDANGCQNTDQMVINAIVAPTVDAGADVSLCEGGSTTLTASGTAVTYSWDNGITDGAAFVPTATTTFTLTGTDGIGCQSTDQVTITVNVLPAVNAGTDINACIGGDVTLSGSGAVSYNWDNGVTDGVAFTAASTNTYTVTGTDANGCVNTDQVTVTVNALPTVNAGADQTVCQGSAVVLSGSGAVSYNWDNGVTDDVAFTASATNTYTVNGTDANGCQNTDQVTVTVNAAPTATATDNGDATITASTGSSYQWINCDGAAIAGATSQNFTATANGNFAVVVTNANGCSDTSSCVLIDYIGLDELTDATIHVFPNPTSGDVFVQMSADNASIEVRDAQGKLLNVTTVSNGEKVSLAAYETGVYFLRIKTENGQAIERIVKN